MSATIEKRRRRIRGLTMQTDGPEIRLGSQAMEIDWGHRHHAMEATVRTEERHRCRITVEVYRFVDWLQLQ
jgi:hypothetical protein